MLKLGLLVLFTASQTQLAPEQALIRQIADSGRCVNLAESADRRVATTPAIAPGPAPLLSFRYYEGRLHHRYGNVDLMLDDAGH